MAQQRLIVLISVAQWQVLRFSGAQYLEGRTFIASEENQLPLLHWMTQFPVATVAFLADIADEHYHVEVLPPVRGAARKQLLERRLAAWPLAQALHTVHYIDSVQGVRREDRYLFSAMHCPPLQRWLQGLQQQGMRVQGIYTQALCLPCWLPGKTHCLYVWVDKQQVRLCYLYQARLLFSRLLVLPAAASLAARIADEVIQTRFYLMSQHWLQESESLHLLYLSGEDSMDDLAQQPWPPAIQLASIAYQALARHSAEVVPESLSVMDWAAVQVILNTRRLPNFAPVEVLMRDRIARAKRMIRNACAVMACLFAMAAWSAHRQLQQAQLDVQAAQASVLRWQAAMPVLEVSEAALPQLHAQVLAIQALEASARLPDRLLQILQQTMPGLDSWQLQKLAWQYEPATGRNGQADRHWVEQVSLTFARRGNRPSVSASQDWQEVLERLRSHPDISGLIETSASSTADNPVLRGDTRLMREIGDQQQLEIRLHQRGNAT